jgi:hypothetical protein
MFIRTANKIDSRSFFIYIISTDEGICLPGSFVKFPPSKKPAIRGGLRKAGMKQDVQEKTHPGRFIKTAVKTKEANYGKGICS